MRTGTALPPSLSFWGAGRGMVSKERNFFFLPLSVGKRGLTHPKPTCPLIFCPKALKYLNSTFWTVFRRG